VVFLTFFTPQRHNEHNDIQTKNSNYLLFGFSLHIRQFTPHNNPDKAVVIITLRFSSPGYQRPRFSTATSVSLHPFKNSLQRLFDFLK